MPNEEFEDITLNGKNLNNIRKNAVRDRLDGMQIKIGGFKFKVGHRARLLERFAVTGQTDFFNDSILLDSNLTEGNTLATLWHEILECVNRKFHIDMPHELLETLEETLFQALIDNPKFLEELIKYSKKYHD